MGVLLPLNEDWFNYSLICPVCQQDDSYTHARVTQVDVASGQAAIVGVSGEDDWSEVSVVKTSGLPLKQRRSHRRDAVSIQFECENGCFFEIAFKQHKGFTYVHVYDHTPVVMDLDSPH